MALAVLWGDCWGKCWWVCGVIMASHYDLNDGCDGHDWGDFDEGAYYKWHGFGVGFCALRFEKWRGGMDSWLRMAF